MRTEQIQTRIEGYTSNLSQAVQSGSGAQFSMLLSLIHSNQQLMKPDAAPVVGDGSFALPQVETVYPDPSELHDGQVVERLNTAVHDGLVGDFAYVNGYLYSHSNTPRQQKLASDEYAKVGLMSTGQLMIDEIEQSREQIKVAA
ncbi:hypothetical protein [Neptuniibacter caesariensis]|uniref:Uncharacterized protein n=1 Tax=Neptuniibacter caesariensis TaxID=207954 RepID=A0A7U8C1G1_NEPCE|nr:hypothetical protein [Neptuniibacter caesariensis]EAR59777.1 hypothetical protein MED92_08445 [Oceanospirillum sp. MED92] [Neptuniibacter caesariensis]